MSAFLDKQKFENWLSHELQTLIVKTTYNDDPAVEGMIDMLNKVFEHTRAGKFDWTSEGD